MGRTSEGDPHQMTPRLVPVCALAVAGLLFASFAHAACPGSCSAPGGGLPRTDCIVEFDGVTPNYPASRPSRVRCTDGDPACDTDGTANGVCHFLVRGCLNNTDPSVPGCTPSDVASFAVSNRSLGHPKHDPQLQAIEDAVLALGLPSSSAVCSAPQPIELPLRVRGGRFALSKKTIKATARTSGGTVDVDRVKLSCLPSPLFPSPGATYSIAKEITAPAELIEGTLSRGRLGDFLLANDKIQVVIQQPGRVMFGIGPYGGNIIDADRQRPSGNERDNFEEWAPAINIENTANYTNVSVLNDGSNGMPGKIRATGPDDLLDYVNASSVVAGFGFTFPAGADDHDLPVDVQTDYTLEPGKTYVKVETTLTNTGAAPLDIYFGEYLNGSGQVELFQPTYGFGEPLLTDPPCPASTFAPCTAGMCDLCDF